MAMLQSSTVEERILYWLSLDTQVRALAEGLLLQRFAVTVGDLPASAQHHHAEPGGLYQHSLEVALKALEEFEGNMSGAEDRDLPRPKAPRSEFSSFVEVLTPGGLF